MKAYVPTPSTAHTQPAQLAVKLQDASSSTPWTSQVEVIQQYQYDVWQELIFDFSGQSAATIFDRIVVQFNSENNNETIIGYIDDFKLTNDTSAAATVTCPHYPLMILKEMETLLGTLLLQDLMMQASVLTLVR